MKKKKKAEELRVRHLPGQVAENLYWVESDSYDRAVFRHLRDSSPSVRSLEENGAVLLPGFGEFLVDLFCALFKLHVVFREKDKVRKSVLINFELLQVLRRRKIGDMLREATVLDEERAGLAMLMLGEGALRILRSEKALGRQDLLDVWRLRRQETTTKDTIEAAQNAEKVSGELAELSDRSSPVRQSLEKATDELAKEARIQSAALMKAGHRVEADMSRVRKQTQNRFFKEAVVAATDIDDIHHQIETWKNTLGPQVPSRLGVHMELGKRLTGKGKLKKLAALVGKMRPHAPALQRNAFAKRSQEPFEVTTGAEISRLLPHELVSLHQPKLKKDFKRRLVEKQLLEYNLRGEEQLGRGPLIVCLDGSSSMAGEKEVWAKAVTLTMHQIALKQRRKMRVISFSSRGAPLDIFDLGQGLAPENRTRTIMDLAEHFPGGGTDFEQPLQAALEFTDESAFKRGDIVLITDGECQVKDEWAKWFKQTKKSRGVFLFAILVDVDTNSEDQLKTLSDKVARVSGLTSDETKSLFSS